MPACSLTIIFSAISGCSAAFDTSNDASDKPAAGRRSLWQVAQYFVTTALCSELLAAAGAVARIGVTAGRGVAGAVCEAGVDAAGRAGAAPGVPACAANGDRSASTALAANPRHKTPVPSTAFVPLLIHSPD